MNSSKIIQNSLTKIIGQFILKRKEKKQTLLM